jgi:hypothetical protein
MDELFASGIKLGYPPQYNFSFENGDETEGSKYKEIVQIVHRLWFVRTGQNIRRIYQFC